MAKPPPPLPPGSELPEPLRDRHEMQAIVGQIHGVAALAVANVERWLPKQTGDALEIEAEEIRQAYKEVSMNFGTVQAALTTGELDEGLAQVGLTGPQMQPKKKGFWAAVQRFFRTSGNTVDAWVKRMRSSIGWSNTLLGSLGAAFRKEIEKVPLASAALEGIKEFLEVLEHASESHDAPAPAGNRAKGKEDE